MFIHPPDLGVLCSHDGNMAKRQKGMARARENPSMPMAGPNLSPEVAASTSSVPIIGPVQENDTKVSVNAIKNMLMSPVVRSAVASILFAHFEGNFMSNAPKNDMANTTSRRKNMMLHTALVDSALSELGPNMAVTIMPRSRYMTMIEAP